MNRSDNKCHVIYMAFIVAATLALYWNALSGDFIWDDRGLITDNTAYLNDWKNLYTGFYKPYFGETPYYRPLLTGSFIIDYHFWELNPFGYHLTNLILHLLNALLVYLFMLIILKQTTLALLTSLLFTAHPVQSEAVAWISGRNDVLFTLFALISIILHVRWTHFQGWRRQLAYACCHLAYLAALLTKESGIVLPMLFVLIDYFYPDSRRGKTKAYAGIVLITAVYYFTRTLVIGNTVMRLTGGGLFETLAGVVATYAYYFRMLLFPVFQSALPDLHSFGSVNLSIISSGSFMLCLLAIAIIASTRMQEVSLAILWVLVSLIPVCGVFPLSVPALEHRLYLGTVCFSMLLPCTVYRILLLQTRTKKVYAARSIVALIIPAVMTVYSSKTVTRNAAWNNDLSFWLTTVEASPGSVLARNGLGIVYARAGNHQMAIGEFKQGLALHDQQGSGGDGHGNLQRAKILNNLGQCYYQLLLQELPADKSISRVDAPGRDTIKRLFALSLTSYHKALTINPANHEVRINLKDLFYLMKNYPPAEEKNQNVSAAHHGRL